MSLQATITAVELRNYKTFQSYSVKLQHMNILIGPNNAGKSTVLSAFRVLEIALRKANSKKPALFKGPSGVNQLGHSISEEALPVSVENIHTNYEDVDTTVRFKLSNGNSLYLFFPVKGGCYLFPDANGREITSPKAFKEHFPLSISIIPVLGPLEHNEQLYTEETVRKGLVTHRASSHFRNYWYYYSDNFDDFARLVRETWPGMEVEQPALDLEDDPPKLTMFCLENRYLRELYWAGFGFQVWCQLLMHISRCSKHSILIVDEPEIYLHPDLQRQLINILRNSGPDIILATHSAEIMSDADSSEIVMIDRQKRTADRLRDVEGVQAALNLIGSVQNITLTQLARSKRLLFVNSVHDLRILRWFAQKLEMHDLATGNGITVIEAGGFSAWERIHSLAWGLESLFNSFLQVGAIFRNEYWSIEEANSILTMLSSKLQLAHIYDRMEIENYLLVPPALERALVKVLKDRARRTGTSYVESEPIAKLLDKVTLPLKNKIQAQYIAKRLDFLENEKLDKATITAETIELFEAKWHDLHTRMDIVPGKDVLTALKTEIMERYAVNLTDYAIVDAFRTPEIPADLQRLVKRMDEFRKSSIG